MSLHLLFSLCCAGLALALWQDPRFRALALGPAGLAVWQGHCAIAAARRPKPAVVLRLSGFAWDLHAFCRGWLITGQVGSGKTAAAINTMLWQVSQNVPGWGGVCVDDKGVYWETLSAMLQKLGRASDLILLQVRPDGAAADWKPTHRFNFLALPHLPYSAKAKLVCDVAASLGQRSEQSFFRLQAQVQMEFAFRALHAAGLPVTLESACDFISSAPLLAEVMERVAQSPSREAEALKDHYEHNFRAQPPEQLGGVKTTIANYLKYFTDPAIAEVFCPRQSTFDFDAIDRGKIICISLPQRYAVERRYLNTLLKLAYYSHALRRFDRPAAARARDNLLILWADEAQKIVTASDDGMSDYNVVDVIREARATLVAATQSHLSLIPPLGDDRKAKVFIANLANRITFRAADEDSAKIAADTIGKRMAKRHTTGWSGGRRTTSVTDEERHYLAPHELRRLRPFEAVVQHCDYGFRRVTLPPLGTDGRVPAWYALRA